MEKNKAFSLMLDYETIVLDQLAQTYSVLTEQEEVNCLFHRCYVNDVEKPIKQNTCGIPQYFDQLLNQCSHKETDGVSIFLKPMEPDGVLFAFRREVSSQFSS